MLSKLLLPSLLCLILVDPCLCADGETAKEFLSGDLFEDNAEHVEIVGLDKRNWRLIRYCQYLGDKVKYVKNFDFNSMAQFKRSEFVLNLGLQHYDPHFESVDFWEAPKVERGRTRTTISKPRVKPFPDFPVLPGMFFGGECYLWELGLWKKLPEWFAKRDIDYVLYDGCLDRNRPVTDAKYLTVNSRLYALAENKRQKMIQDGRPVSGVEWVDCEELSEDVKGSFECIDGAMRIFFDEDTGTLAVYFTLFGNTPRNVSFSWLPDPILDVFAVTNELVRLKQKEVTDFILCNHELPDGPDILEYPSSYYFENLDEDERGKGTLPPPNGESEPCERRLPYDYKLKDLRLTMYPGCIVGNGCKIWELKIWNELGKRLQQAPKPYYLFISDTLSIVEDQLPCHLDTIAADRCVKIDLPLYHRMERLRKIAESSKGK